MPASRKARSLTLTQERTVLDFQQRQYCSCTLFELLVSSRTRRVVSVETEQMPGARRRTSEKRAPNMRAHVPYTFASATRACSRSNQ